MLKIRDAQMAALKQDKLAAFFERVEAFIAAKLRRPVLHSEIQTLYERGKSYELRSEQDFVRYMFVGALVGSASHAEDPDWMRMILDVVTPANDLKLRRLFDEAQRHVPPGMTLPAP